MSMTKKDFEGIANVLNQVLWTPGTDPLTMSRCVIAVAGYCSEANELFDFDRFQQAAFADNGTHVPLEVNHGRPMD